MKPIKIGTRDSKLAMAQAQQVADAIMAQNPAQSAVLVPMKTTGDLILDKTLDKIGGKGLFVRELDRALQSGEVDLTVHSYKDMTMDIDPMTPIVATGHRMDPRDVLVLPKGIERLDPSKPIGSASHRRGLQLRRLFAEHAIAPVRGNLQTRLSKLDRGDYSALVLAAAGLERLGLSDRISRRFTTEEIIPANCQGVIAVQGRMSFPIELLSGFHSSDSYNTSLAERAFVRALGGGCSQPIAAYAEIDELLQLKLTGLYVDLEEYEEYSARLERGEPAEIEIIQGTRSGNIKEAEQIGEALAQELMARRKR